MIVARSAGRRIGRLYAGREPPFTGTSSTPRSAPAPHGAELAAAREAIAHRRQAAEEARCCGTARGRDVRDAHGPLLVNELAPRPHNSGHWTIDACITSQFEQLVRAICGLPLGSPERHSDAVMKNLIGAEVKGWRAALADPGAKLHLYGKGKPVPGRKMGHVTRLKPKS